MMCRCNECANRYGSTYRDTGDGPKYEVYCRLDQARGRYILRDEYAQHECKGFEPRGNDMKCDELKHEQWLDYAGEPMPCYPKAEVDAAIAELKDVIHELQVDLEGAKATAYADSVDAGMRERRLQRALYKACANWALSTLAWLDCIDQGEPRKWSKMLQKCLKKAEEYK